MTSSTRSVKGYRFCHKGEAHTFHVTIRHFDIGRGFDVPLFENVFTTQGHVGKEETTVSARGPLYHVFFTEESSTDQPNEALLLLEDGPAFAGEVVVLRRAVMQDRYVHFRPGDKQGAVNAVMEVMRKVKREGRYEWHEY